MFAAQTATVVAFEGDELVGRYICIPTASGAAWWPIRWSARTSGFAGLKYNAVVKINIAAIALYLSLGFEVLGTVKNSYRLGDGTLTDPLIFYHARSVVNRPPKAGRGRMPPSRFLKVSQSALARRRKKRLRMASDAFLRAFFQSVRLKKGES